MALPLFEKYPALEKRLPWISLGNWPTPVQKLKTLGKTVGYPNIWIKHDDLSSGIYGGNKVRKLEFILADALKKKHYEAVAIVHNETSTGAENPVKELAAVAHEVSPDTLVMVDAVSSLGGTLIDSLNTAAGSSSIGYLTVYTISAGLFLLSALVVIPLQPVRRLTTPSRVGQASVPSRAGIQGPSARPGL